MLAMVINKQKSV